MNTQTFSLISFITLALSNTLCGFSQCKPHYLHLGPDIYYRDYDEKVPEDKTFKSHEFGWFKGFNIGYDYLKPSSLYFGADLNFSWSNTVYDGAITYYFFDGEKLTEPYRSITNNFIFDAEMRIGYTFTASSCTLLTPFIGFGHHYWHRGICYKDNGGFNEDYDWPYFSWGFRIVTRISKNFDLGLNLKSMRMLNAMMKTSHQESRQYHLGNEWQFQVEFPVTYNFDCHEGIVNAIRIKPYYCNRNIGRSNVIAADNPSRGWTHTLEPASTTHVYGISLELIKEF